jgi:hypothetical protein
MRPIELDPPASPWLTAPRQDEACIFRFSGVVNAVDLVNAHPGCTVAELVRYTPAADGAAWERESARHQLHQALHAAASDGQLRFGPERHCQERSAVVITWLPAALLGDAVLARSGLGILEDLVGRAIHELQIDEALA